MKAEALSIHVSDSIGKVSAEYFLPDNPKCLLILAHGAGAGMDHIFMVTLAKSLANCGIATVRFNFPFMEQKKRKPDFPAAAHKTIESVIDHAIQNYPQLLLFVSGKSFGGRMTSQLLTIRPNNNVKGIIFYGFPLHPVGKPGTDRADHLQKINIPMLFLQGTRDALADYELITEVCKSLPSATLVTVEGADHSFKAGKTDTMKILTDETVNWISRIEIKS